MTNYPMPNNTAWNRTMSDDTKNRLIYEIKLLLETKGVNDIQQLYKIYHELGGDKTKLF